MWTKEKVDLSHLWVFGCKAFAHVPSGQRNKLNSKSHELMFVSNWQNSKAYRPRYIPRYPSKNNHIKRCCVHGGKTSRRVKSQIANHARFQICRMMTRRVKMKQPQRCVVCVEVSTKTLATKGHGTKRVYTKVWCWAQRDFFSYFEKLHSQIVDGSATEMNILQILIIWISQLLFWPTTKRSRYTCNSLNTLFYQDKKTIGVPGPRHHELVQLIVLD